MGWWRREIHPLQQHGARSRRFNGIAHLRIKKVYADKTLPYSQNDKFPEPPEGFEPCYKEDIVGDVVEEQPVEAVENAFE